MSHKEKELKRLAEEYGYAPLMLKMCSSQHDGMDWWFDFKMHRARVLEEIAAELGADVGKIRDVKILKAP